MQRLRNKNIKPRDTDTVNILFCVHSKLKSQKHFPCSRAKSSLFKI